MRGTSIIILAGVVLLAGCTREKLEHSQVNFSIANSIMKKSSDAVNATDIAMLQHMSLNVTGVGMDRIICSIDADNGVLRGAEGPCQITPGADGFRLSLDIAPGTGRLFQLAMAYKGADGDSIYYGDTVKDIAGIQLAFDIPVKQVGANATTSGHFSGRWMTTATGGPSGPVSISVAPDGKPAMVLMNTYMYSGWLTGPALSGVRFEYRVNGDLLFGGPVNLEDMRAAVTTSGGRVGETSHVESSSGRIEYEFFGFYGPGSGGKMYCTSTCAGTEWNDYVKSGSRFYGPFVPTTSGGNTYVRYDAGQVRWQINPTVTSGIEGYSVFYSLNPSSTLQAQIKSLVLNHGQLKCEGLRGLVALTEASIGTGERGFSVPGFNSTSSIAVVCPRVAGKLQNDAVSNQNIYNDGGNNNNNSGPYLRLEMADGAISDGAGNYSAIAGDCVKIWPKLYTGSGQTFPAPQNITLSFSEPFGTFHNNSSCMSGARGSITISQGQSQPSSSDNLYLKIGSSALGVQTFSQSVLPTSVTGISWQPQFNKLSISKMIAKLTMPDSIITNSCVPAQIGFYRPDGSSMAFGDTQDIYFQTALSVYASSSCGDVIDHVQVMSYEKLKKFYVKATSDGAPALALASASTALFGSVLPATTNAAAGVNSYAKVKISVPASVPLGQCGFAYVQLVNDVGQIVVPDRSITVKLSSQNGQIKFFDPGSGTCSSPLSGNALNFSVGGESVIAVPFQVSIPTAVLPMGTVGIIADDGTTTFNGPFMSVGVNMSDAFLYLSAADAVSASKVANWGDHEFPKRVRINYPSGYSFKCAVGMTPAPGDYTSNCGGKISTSNGFPEFLFSKSDQVSDTIYSLMVSQNSDGSGPMRTLSVRFADVYGSNMMIQNCAYTLTTVGGALKVYDSIGNDTTSVGPFTSASNDVAKVTVALSQDAGPVCIGPNTVINQQSGTDAIQMSQTNAFIVGAVDGTSVFMGLGAASGVRLVSVTASAPPKIANMVFDLRSTSANAIGVYGGGGHGIISQGNRYRMNNAETGSYAIFTQDGMINVSDDKFEDVAGIALKMEATSNMSDGLFHVEHSEFYLIGASTSATKIYSSLSSATLDLDLSYNRFNGNGHVFIPENPSGAVDIFMQSNFVDLGATNGGGLIEMDSRLYNVVLHDNQIRLKNGSAFLTSQASSSPSGGRVFLAEDNRFTVINSASILAVNGDYASTFLTLRRNHFGAESGASGVAAISSDISVTNLSLTSENNKMCSFGAGNFPSFINASYTTVGTADIPTMSAGTMNQFGYCAP